MGFNMDVSALRASLDRMRETQLFRMQSYAQTAAKELEAEAKAGAPWTDRTAAARTGLNGSAMRSGSIITITLRGSVRYMVYLELAHGKKWAILWPTMQSNAERIMQGFARIGGIT